MNKLNKHLAELENMIPKHSAANLAVSKANVGWHIEHVLLVIDAIIDSLKKSDATHYKRAFNLTKVIVFLMNKIPRGRAKSPEVTVPKPYDEKSLQMHLQATQSKIKELETIHADQYFKHPMFGDLKLKEAIKMINLHTNHHLKIIADILK